ncbi:DUF4435 domain-containing protein [Spirulina sp. CS-785/01]|uniref:DUF4435 domain-containing protein n=1 Tax=Spirulina sp. CS-785/01 TaxID=3021716 RepID=UPI00232D9495|nr:DUF4435 domain-containing protein [Spirulina sp. CS-785/01]MDB9312411.1 DUF4435 domain-containing protein [Spirulina sp. CS-785/01]
MREYLTPDRDANQIRMRRSSFLGTFLLVEGDTDKKFYYNLINRDLCQVVTLSGKPSSKERVIVVLRILNQDNFQGVLAIVDADFDHLLDSPVSWPNLFRTDTHDLETLLIQSPALEKVLIELGSEEKIKQFSQDIRETLLNAGLSLGYLRWISQQDGLNLTFNGLKFNKFINDKSLAINENDLIKAVKNKSQQPDLSNPQLQEQLTTFKNNTHDPWQVCCGHDLVEILSLGLRKTLGTNNKVEPEKVEISLRLAYEAVYFQDTTLYADICQWETDHPPFRCWK